MKDGTGSIPFNPHRENSDPRTSHIRPYALSSLAFLSLGAGVWIYLLFRETPEFLYQGMQWVGMSESIDRIRQCMPILPGWIIYVLPDALWMFSFSILILMIWGFQRSAAAFTWIVLAILIGGGMEILQWFGILPGKFDLADLAAMLFAALLPFCFTIKSKSP